MYLRTHRFIPSVPSPTGAINLSLIGCIFSSSCSVFLFLSMTLCIDESRTYFLHTGIAICLRDWSSLLCKTKNKNPATAGKQTVILKRVINAPSWPQHLIIIASCIFLTYLASVSQLAPSPWHRLFVTYVWFELFLRYFLYTCFPFLCLFMSQKNCMFQNALPVRRLAGLFYTADWCSSSMCRKFMQLLREQPGK